MNSLFRLSILLLCVTGLTGCASERLTPAQRFALANPKIANGAAELYEIPLDEWADFEFSEGLGLLRSKAIIWKEGYLKLNPSESRDESIRSLSELIESTDSRLIDCLVSIYYVRAEMSPGDSLIYCHRKDDKSECGRFFIVRKGRVRKEVTYLTCTWEGGM
jgi:hypothetical protein